MLGFLKSILYRTPRKVTRARKPAPPRVEALEERAVPSYMVMDVPNHGIYLVDTNPYGHDSGFIANNHADKLAVDSSGDVVADIPGRGVLAWSNGSGSNRGWHQLSRWNATALAIAGSGGSYNVAVSFQGQGTYENTGYSSLTQLTSVTATMLGIDTSGNILGEFPRNGVYYHAEYGNWQRVTPYHAHALSYAEGWGVISVTGHGTYLGQPAQYSWQQISTTTADNVFVDGNGDVLASVNSRPMQIYSSGHWQNPISGSKWAGMTSDEVGAYFPNQGLYTYNTATGKWTRLLSYTADCFAFQE
jgi:hypothetical protein